MHSQRALTADQTDWLAIARLYEGLVRLSPTAGAMVGRAVAVGYSIGAAAGLNCLDALSPDVANSFQPAWAARAHLLEQLGQHQQAAKAYDRAIGLTQSPAQRAWLVTRATAARAAT